MIPLLYQLSYTGTGADDSVSDLCCPDRPSGTAPPVVAWPKAILRTLGHLVLPSSCLLCHSYPLPGQLLCAPCCRDLPIPSQICSRCLHRPGSARDRCPGCHHQTPMRPLLHISRHEGTLRKLILSAKNGHKDHLGSVLARQLALLVDRTEFFRQPSKPPVVLAIPRSLPRRISHGAPLSERIAVPFARFLGFQFHRWLRRKGSRPQVSLSPAARRRLTHRSFIACPHHRALVEQRRTAILVDDVRTTGATLSAATRALERKGITVRMWVVASVSRRTTADRS